jgi:hypothetical protein
LVLLLAVVGGRFYDRLCERAVVFLSKQHEHLRQDLSAPSPKLPVVPPDAPSVAVVAAAAPPTLAAVAPAQLAPPSTATATATEVDSKGHSQNYNHTHTNTHTHSHNPLAIPNDTHALATKRKRRLVTVHTYIQRLN